MPPVTSQEPRAARVKLTAEQRREGGVQMAYANNRQRPFTLAPDGYPAPTALEIEEGIAHKLMSDNPKSKMLGDEWSELWWRICTVEGMVATSRCAACHTVLFGRVAAAVGCGVCGGRETLKHTVRRYEP